MERASLPHRDEGFLRAQGGNLYRQISLPDAFEADKITAKIENGILTVQVPKAAQPTAIKVQVGSCQEAAPQKEPVETVGVGVGARLQGGPIAGPP